MADRSFLTPFDLEAYCARIGYTGELVPTAYVLRELHIAHLASIPFENIDVLLGRPVRLDKESLQSKLVASRRGGYCFEQNALFQAALQNIGFRVQGLGARVLMGETTPRPRTHMALLVHVDGEPYLADVGFGADGLLEPLPLVDTGEFLFPLMSFRLQELFKEWTLSGAPHNRWTQLYSFTLEPQLGVDYEVANYYTSTHPESVFRRTLTAQRVLRDKRLTLRGRELRIVTPKGVEERTLRSAAEATRVLKEHFGIELFDDSRLPESLFAENSTIRS